MIFLSPEAIVALKQHAYCCVEVLDQTALPVKGIISVKAGDDTIQVRLLGFQQKDKVFVAILTSNILI